MVENRICCGKEPFGRFCDECGNPTTKVEPDREAVLDPGALVTRWNELLQGLNEAMETFRVVAAEMDSIADTLQTNHRIQLPRQVSETPPLTPSVRESASPNAGALTGEDIGSLVHPEGGVTQPSEGSPVDKPRGASSTILQGTKTGPMGKVERSATAAEVPTGPGEEAVAASRQRATTPQRPIGTIEDTHEGKVDPVVDQARESSGSRSDESPPDDPQAFQANVARTLQRAVQGKT